MPSDSSDREQVFVVLRADFFHDNATDLETIVTAKEVLRSKDLAEREVARLNAMHPDGKVRYWATPSHLFPPGRSASSIEPPA